MSGSGGQCYEHDRLLHIEKQLEKLNDCMMSAFPNGDVDGHRRAHEAAIKAANAQAQFWEEMKLDIAKKGAWGLLVIIIGLVVVGVQVKLGLFLNK